MSSNSATLIWEQVLCFHHWINVWQLWAGGLQTANRQLQDIYHININHPPKAQQQQHWCLRCIQTNNQWGQKIKFTPFTYTNSQIITLSEGNQYFCQKYPFNICWKWVFMIFITLFWPWCPSAQAFDLNCTSLTWSFPPHYDCLHWSWCVWLHHYNQQYHHYNLWAQHSHCDHWLIF